MNVIYAFRDRSLSSLSLSEIDVGFSKTIVLRPLSWIIYIFFSFSEKVATEKDETITALKRKVEELQQRVAMSDKLRKGRER